MGRWQQQQQQKDARGPNEMLSVSLFYLFIYFKVIYYLLYIIVYIHNTLNLIPTILIVLNV